LNSELSDVDPHQRAMGLIPWYVNGTLDPAERPLLSTHLAACAPCRADYEAQVRLFEAMQADQTVVFAAEPSFQKLMSRIGATEDAAGLAAGGAAPQAPLRLRAPTGRRAFGGAVRWLAAAAVLEALGLGYGAWSWHAHATPGSAYVTLTSADPSYRESPRVRIVFRSGLSMQGLGSILHSADAHIIDGPTDSNVYTLGFTGADVSAGLLERRVATLRASSDVLFAEPLGVVNAGAGDEAK
jgi:Putative zinc-finger